MKAPVPWRADMRAFRWHLAPLERKLEASIEVARVARAHLQRQADVLQRSIDLIAEQRRRELKDAARATRIAIDPRVHARILQYLVQLSGTIERKQEEAVALRRRIDAEARACADAERQLACVERMREAAQAAYAAGQFRTAEKEADLTWLAARAREDRGGWVGDEGR